MSSSLLRKSLQLFEEKGEPKRNGKAKVKEDSLKRGIKKRKKRTADHTSKAKTSLAKESALDTYNRDKALDFTDDSLYYLNMISNAGGQPDSKTVNTILEYNKGKLSKNQRKKETIPKEKSVFSDKDFEEFRKEYLNS
ncbi:active regulator of SIRT1-like [Crassostrea virginica]